jgi:formylglycine-generating enzyme required for sulfatase activity
MRRWFLSYNSQDAALAEALESELRRKDPGAAVYFAPKSLRPGAYWMPALVEEIAQATGFVLLIGPNGLGPWQTIEYYEAYDRRAKEPDFPLVLVLIEGQPAPGLPFLRQLHWIVTADPASEKSVAQLLAAASEGGTPPGELWRHTAPYRGLAAMTQADADFFFGRGRETAEAVGALAAAPERLALLIGNSGVGKSSLAQAGIVAALMRQAWPETDAPDGPWPQAFRDSRRWCFLKLSLGTEPVRALVEPFLRTWQFDPVDPARARLLSDWTANLVAGSAGLRDLLDATEARYRDDLKQPAPPAFLLYIDQGEELYLRGEERQRRCFSELVAAGLSDRRMRAMMSLRADFFGELQKDEALYGVHRQINVPPLREAALRTVVGRPASLLQVRFESERLAADIARRTAEDSATDAGALPLLSYLLDDMWTRMVERGDGVLRLPAQAIDLGGVLVERGEAFVSAHPDREDAIKRILTLKLATVREDGEPTRRRARRSEFSDDEWRLVGGLADHPNRLVVTVMPEGGEAYAEIAHEAVFRRWDRLREWIAEAREFLIWKSAVEAERRAWSAAPARAKSGALLAGLKLAQAQAWLRSRRADVEQPERDFVATSRRAARWRLARLCGMVAAAPVAVGLFAVIVWVGFVWWGVRQVEAEWAAKREFVRIPAGCFQMGSPDGSNGTVAESGRYDNEGPVHQVCLKPFDLAKFTVTQGEWRRVMVGVMGFPVSPDPSRFKSDDLPVEQVNWDEARLFVRLMSLFGHGHYRLPSEAEYEYATRAGTTTSRYWGDNIDDGCAYENIADQSLKKAVPGMVPVFANCDDRYAEATAAVGTFRPNPWGLYDMLGNVEVWTEDCYADNYRDIPTDGSPNTSGPCTIRVVRGGSWDNDLRGDRAADRDNWDAPVNRKDDLGFRLARTVPP